MESTNSAAEQDSAAAKRLSGIGFEAREVAARMYASMRRAGIDVQDARAHVQAAIPNVSDRTLRRWVSHIDTKYDDMVHDFLEFHKETLQSQEVIFFSDNGSAFKNANGSVIEQMGYANHVFYPACVHQYLSPNDNKLHGAAKSKWHGMPISFDDDVESSIALMKSLDDVPQDAIRSWWVSNFFLSSGIVRDDRVRRAIFDAESKWSGLHEACIHEYESWFAHEERLAEQQEGTPKRDNAGLDGPYWSKK